MEQEIQQAIRKALNEYEGNFNALVLHDSQNWDDPNCCVATVVAISHNLPKRTYNIPVREHRGSYEMDFYEDDWQPINTKNMFIYLFFAELQGDYA